MKRYVLLISVLCLGVACSSSDPSSKPNPNNANNSNNANNANNSNNANNVNNVNNVNNANNVPGRTFRIATFNVRRFFDTVCNSGNCDGDAFESVNSEAEFNFKANQLTTAIDNLGADAIMLQELETQACLDAIMERTTVFDFGELGETGGTGSLDVAVLSRGERTKVVSHKGVQLARPGGGTTSFTRDFLEVHANHNGETLVLFSAHFKSKRNDDPQRRLAEAMGANDIMLDVQASNPDALIVLGGDLNDDPGSAPIDALDAGDVTVLSEPEVYTYSYLDVRQQIDHLAVTDYGAGYYVDGTLAAVDDGSGSYGSSDHAALIAEFFIPD